MQQCCWQGGELERLRLPIRFGAAGQGGEQAAVIPKSGAWGRGSRGCHGNNAGPRNLRRGGYGGGRCCRRRGVRLRVLLCGRWRVRHVEIRRIGRGFGPDGGSPQAEQGRARGQQARAQGDRISVTARAGQGVTCGAGWFWSGVVGDYGHGPRSLLVIFIRSGNSFNY